MPLTNCPTRPREFSDLYTKPAPIAEALFAALCAHPYGLTNNALCELIYGHRADGGADHAQWSLQVTVCSFNRRAAKAGLGLRIRGSGGPGSKYLIYVVKPPVVLETKV